MEYSKGRYDIGSLNNKVSSLTVPYGCVARLYADEEFGGVEAVFKPGEYETRMMAKVGMEEDTASSIIIEDYVISDLPNAVSDDTMMLMNMGGGTRCHVSLLDLG